MKNWIDCKKCPNHFFKKVDGKDYCCRLNGKEIIYNPKNNIYADCSYIIFLDVDGVLNHISTKERTLDSCCIGIDKNNLKILKNLVSCFESYDVVIISSWKSFPKDYEFLIQTLKSEGINVAGRIYEPNNNTALRGQGILNYLKSNNFNSKRFFILDDEQFDYKETELGWHLIQTSFYNKGLQKKHINRMMKKVRELDLL